MRKNQIRQSPLMRLIIPSLVYKFEFQQHLASINLNSTGPSSQPQHAVAFPAFFLFILSVLFLLLEKVGVAFVTKLSISACLLSNIVGCSSPRLENMATSSSLESLQENIATSSSLESLPKT